jgi:hypothetical protein
MFDKLLCLCGQHRLRVIGYPEPDSRVVVVHHGCLRCKKQWVISHREQAVLPWSAMRAFYADTWNYEPTIETVRARLNPANWTRNAA